MATLDFSKLASAPPGEAFEGLVRLMGERLGMVVQWSGRGADGGRDLIFVETQVGPIKTRPVRWLVSCKDNSDSNRSVTERDVGSVLDKVQQHKCDGFLLATTTTASTGLKDMLDQLDITMGGCIQTKVWDRFEITQTLLSSRCTDLLLQFFPDHQRREAVAKLDAAREVVEASLPRFIAGEVRECLVPHAERLALLSGKTVWPHDADQHALIDELATSWRHVPSIEKVINSLHFDAFMSFADALIRNFPKRAVRFLKIIAQISNDNGVIYNAIEMLRESGSFTLEEELKITSKCDSDTLFELYNQMAHDALYDTGAWDDRLPKEIRMLSDCITIDNIDVDELIFSGGEGVYVSARVRIKVTGSPYDPDEAPAQGRFTCNVGAYFDRNGLVIDSVE